MNHPVITFRTHNICKSEYDASFTESTAIRSDQDFSREFRSTIDRNRFKRCIVLWRWKDTCLSVNCRRRGEDNSMSTARTKGLKEDVGCVDVLTKTVCGTVELNADLRIRC